MSPGLATQTRADRNGAFRHEAFLYAGEKEFVERIAAFVRDGLADSEPVFVIVGRRKLGLLAEALGQDWQRVEFADMEQVGANPARIIPAWSRFTGRHLGEAMRGVGEPIWPGRSPEEVIECQGHEALLNTAFAAAHGMWVICPYDTDSLDGSIVDEVFRNHPLVSRHHIGRAQRSTSYSEDATILNAPFGDRLTEKSDTHTVLALEPGDLTKIRRVVAMRAADAGLDEQQIADLVLATSEVVSNSLVHGGGQSSVRLWKEPDALVCEIRDTGTINQPLVGREQPTNGQIGGRGLWVANQLCDLVQIRSSAAGTVVRLRMRRDRET